MKIRNGGVKLVLKSYKRKSKIKWPTEKSATVLKMSANSR